MIGLLDYPEAIYLWKVHKMDFLNWVVACLGTLFLGVEMGLAIAVGVSLLNVLRESAYPPTSVMGRFHFPSIRVVPFRKAEGLFACITIGC